MYYVVESGHGFSVIDEQTGRKREAFAEELTQPQQLFVFYAKEERKRMRQEDDGGNDPHSDTHHIA